MKKIELNGKVGKGKFVLIDDEDFDYLSRFRWHYDNGYAFRRVYLKGENGKFSSSKYENIYMHNLIVEPPKGQVVDHVNRNGLDNRKENLRSGTWYQNLQNRRTPNNNTSGFKGVSFSRSGKRIKRWMVQIQLNRKPIFIGRFSTPTEAALAYNQAAKEYFGEFAYLNQI